MEVTALCGQFGVNLRRRPVAVQMMAGKQFFKGQPAGEAQVAHGLNLAENPVAVERAQQLFQTPPGKVAVIVAEHGRHFVRQLNGNFNWHHWNLTGADKIATHVANKGFLHPNLSCSVGSRAQDEYSTIRWTDPDPRN